MAVTPAVDITIHPAPPPPIPPGKATAPHSFTFAMNKKTICRQRGDACTPLANRLQGIFSRSRNRARTHAMRVVVFARRMHTPKTRTRRRVLDVAFVDAGA